MSGPYLVWSLFIGGAFSVPAFIIGMYVGEHRAPRIDVEEALKYIHTQPQVWEPFPHEGKHPDPDHICDWRCWAIKRQERLKAEGKDPNG